MKQACWYLDVVLLYLEPSKQTRLEVSASCFIFFHKKLEYIIMTNDVSCSLSEK